MGPVNFINWWVVEIYRIINFWLLSLNSISFGPLTLLDFILTITLIGIFLGILLSSPGKIAKEGRKRL